MAPINSKVKLAFLLLISATTSIIYSCNSIGTKEALDKFNTIPSFNCSELYIKNNILYVKYTDSTEIGDYFLNLEIISYVIREIDTNLYDSLRLNHKILSMDNFHQDTVVIATVFKKCVSKYSSIKYTKYIEYLLYEDFENMNKSTYLTLFTYLYGSQKSNTNPFSVNYFDAVYEYLDECQMGKELILIDEYFDSQDNSNQNIELARRSFEKMKHLCSN